MNNLNNDIKKIIIRDNPDKEIEIFWLGFKHSVKNFCKVYNLEIPIDTWSNILNWYQESKDYENIKKHIHIFISYYSVHIFKNKDCYHTSILWTNVKRWNKITNNFNFIKNDELYFNIYHLLLDIFRTVLLSSNKINEILDFFHTISESIEEDDLYILIDLSIKFKLGNIIDKINIYKNFNIYIEDKYNIEIPNKMSGKKIINLICN